MKHIKIMYAFLAATLVLAATSLSACSEAPAKPAAETAAETAAQAAESSAATESKPLPEVDRLPFLNDGELYVEVNLQKSVKNAAVSLDGTKMSGSKTAYKKGAVFELSGDFAEDGSVNIILVTSKGTKGAEGSSVEFKSGVDVDMVSSLITKFLDRENAQKVFISIFEKDGSWDKSLSEEMNRYIAETVPSLN